MRTTTARPIVAYRAISFWCSPKNVILCSTSRANLSLFKSLRVILDTKTSRESGNFIITCTEPSRTGAPGGIEQRACYPERYASQDPGPSRLCQPEFSHAD